MEVSIRFRLTIRHTVLMRDANPSCVVTRSASRKSWIASGAFRLLRNCKRRLLDSTKDGAALNASGNLPGIPTSLLNSGVLTEILVGAIGLEPENREIKGEHEIGSHSEVAASIPLNSPNSSLDSSLNFPKPGAFDVFNAYWFISTKTKNSIQKVNIFSSIAPVAINTMRDMT